VYIKLQRSHLNNLEVMSYRTGPPQ